IPLRFAATAGFAQQVHHGGTDLEAVPVAVGDGVLVEGAGLLGGLSKRNADAGRTAHDGWATLD
ncbi:hypothetical protein, partial [Streptomyces viridochromogenes]|uniref:hypothetical protein n=1 Tax=Streptomyces viridochromogenes TaxID=1938 RepID=UPI001F316B14